MRMNEKVKKFINDVAFAFIAQGISLILSVLMSLVVPKVLGVEEFGYWQLFLFYSSYVGFFHFGLNDGIYLKYGGIDYDKLNFSLLCSQFWILFIVQALFACFITLLGFLYVNDYNRQFIFVSTAIFLILSNMSYLLGYIFQATNRIKVFSISVIIDKLFFIISVLMLVILKAESFKVFIILYLIAKSISLIYCIFEGKKLVFLKLYDIKITISEMIFNISRGINLMFSNIASMLILGSSRLIIDKIWGIQSFGKISFSLSLTNFFLLFIGQVGMVLFPTLRRISGEQQKKFYDVSRSILGIVLAGVLLLYVPVNYVLDLWLPKYSESLRYLILLLPLCTFDGKMQMLCNTYLKVLKKEKSLFKINLISMGISFVLCLIGSYIFRNIYIIVIFMVISVAIRTIIAEVYLAKLMNALVIKSILLEILLVCIFVVSTWFLNGLLSFIIYLAAYSLFLFIKRKEIIETKKVICSVVRK